MSDGIYAEMGYVLKNLQCMTTGERKLSAVMDWRSCLEAVSMSIADKAS